MPANSEDRTLATLFTSNTSMNVQLAHSLLLCYMIHNSLDPGTVSRRISCTDLESLHTLEQVLHRLHGQNQRQSRSLQGLHGQR